jgi:hypothetical protein
MWLKIKNAGEIELNAFKLIGACTKREDEESIGYFGSGLKYAIATLLRENIDFKIFSGVEEIKVTTEPEMFRDVAFNVIYLNGERTNFTTDMGIKWEIWQAVREVYCNALDEGVWDCNQVEMPTGIKGETNFYIRICDKVKDIVDHWFRYFSEDREPHLKNDTGEIFHLYENNTCLYRKGIRCSDTKWKSLFDYNIFDIEINESRIIQNTYELKWQLSKIWSKPSRFMLQRLLATYMDGETIEQLLEYTIDTSYFKPSDVWRDYLRGYILVPYSFAGHYTKRLGDRKYFKLKKELIKKLIDTFGDEIETVMGRTDYRFVEIPMGKREEFLVGEVLKFFEEVKVKIDYPIKYASFLNKQTLGMAVKNTIILSERCLILGKKQIAATILEEAMHLDSLAEDETRDFQNYILNQLITCLENTHGIFL